MTMRRMLAIALGLLFMALAPAHATGLTLPIYPAATIAERAPEFRDVIVGNYERVMRPALTPAEAQKLRGLGWSFPGDPAQVLFDFRAQSTGQIILPVASLLLLKDLATAEAWLTVRGYNSFALLDYMTIIRVNRLGQWPAARRLPMPALGIPANALDDPEVSARRDDVLSKTILFIVAHEMGHLLHGFDAKARCMRNPAGCDYRALQLAEARADAFAVDLLRRMGIVPNSAPLFFMLSSRLQPFPSEFPDLASWRRDAAGSTHPMDADRIAAVANGIARNRAAFASAFPDARVGAAKTDMAVTQLGILSDGLQDRDITGKQLSWARTMLPVDLLPRRSVQPSLRVSAADRSRAEPFEGYFAGSLAATGGAPMRMEILLRPGARGTIVGDAMILGIRSRIEARPASPQLMLGTMDMGGDLYDVRLVGEGTTLRGTYSARTVPDANGAFSLTRNGPMPE